MWVIIKLLQVIMKLPWRCEQREIALQKSRKRDVVTMGNGRARR